MKGTVGEMNRRPGRRGSRRRLTAEKVASPNQKRMMAMISPRLRRQSLTFRVYLLGTGLSALGSRLSGPRPGSPYLGGAIHDTPVPFVVTMEAEALLARLTVRTPTKGEIGRASC